MAYHLSGTDAARLSRKGAPSTVRPAFISPRISALVRTCALLHPYLYSSAGRPQVAGRARVARRYGRAPGAGILLAWGMANELGATGHKAKANLTARVRG